MPPITEQIKNINESVANINKATTDSGLQKLTPITSTALQEQPKVKFPEPTPATKFDTASDIIAGTGDSLMNQLQAEQKQATESAQKGYVDTLSQYTEALASQTGLQSFLAQEEEKAGIRPIAEQVADLEGTINTERLARANLKRRLESTGGGLKSGANAEYQNFANESLFRETNAVIQLGVQSGRLSAAKQSAERLASAYYEQEQNQLNARKELVDANKDLFTQAEQRTFNLRYESAKRELDQKEEELKLTQTTKIDALKMAQMNGAPREVIDAIGSATTPEEVLSAGGQWASSDLLERQVKIEQLNKLREKPEVLRSTNVIDQGGRKLLIDTQTGEVIQDFGVTSTGTDELKQAVTVEKIKAIDNLKAHKGLNSSVGPIMGTRIPLADIFGNKQDFIAGVEQLTKDLTLDNFLKAKENGATFGALTNAEWKIIGDSATKINTWKRGDKDATGTVAQVDHYDVSEDKFMDELDVISNYAKLDAYLKGAEPASIGLTVTPDGKVWAQNGDGSLSQLR